MNYWQIAAGDGGRDYSEEFIRFGMGFVGGDNQVATMREVKTGDRFILKRGVSEILAVGEVVEREGRARGENDKDWLHDFDGWDLPAYCYVRWHKLSPPERVNGLTRGTILGVNKSNLRELTEARLKELPAIEHNPEPVPTKEVSDEQILEFLIQKGLRPSAAEELTSAFRRIRLLAHYYEREDLGWDVLEHETRTFLIVPLLLALGWAEQQIKMELGTDHGKIDIACFSKPYKRDEQGKANDDDCDLILESKSFRSGLAYAPDQAKHYAKLFPNCRVIVVSNGYCYKVYRKGEDGVFGDKPAAYLNLLMPRDKYPIDPENVAGCLEVLHNLLPTFFPR